MLAEATPTGGPSCIYDVVWVDRLAPGLERLAQGEIDIVLCDLVLPDSSGLQTPARVQAAAPLTPIVVMTSLDDEESAVAAVHGGAQDYLVKGQVDGSALRRSIRYARERMQTLKQLRSYAVALEQRNAELDAFAHTVAHDLKNPVAGVIGLAEILRDEGNELDAGQQREVIAELIHSGHTMNNIIQELLLLAQVTRAEVELAPLDMLTSAQQALRRLAQMSATYAAEIALDAPEQWPVAVGYGPWIEEVWVNYLCNALKYGGGPPRVTIGGELLDDALARFWVHDEGPGIPTNIQGQLFAEFTQLNQARMQGHGLGLSIVRRIVEKLGGWVGVESQEGSGSTFYFVLPTSRAV